MSKRTLAAAVVVAAAVGGYWYYSPHIILHGMQSAAEAKDADKLNAYVDYPKLRESIKGEFTARLMEVTSSASSNEFGQAGAALGLMMGTALVDNLVDAMVRPELVMRALSEAKVEEGSADGSRATGQKTASAEKKVEWSLERKASNLVVAYGSDPNGTGERVGVVLERNGFADWKMTGIRLPN